MKIKLLLAFLSLTPLLNADPVLYEGFDMAGQSGSQMGSADTGGGESSTGWMSGWVLKDGMSQYRKDDLRIPGFVSEDGLVANRGRTVVMRQLGESFSGDVYGSFRVRLNQLKENSIVSLLFSVPKKGEHMVNVKTAMLGFIATRWASPLGAVSIGGNVVKVPEGEPMKAGEEILVLWKIENMPEAGKSSNQEIRMWILSSDQAGQFAREGLTEKRLDGAGIGRGNGQVLQSVTVSLSDSKLTLVKGLVVSCFSYEVPDAMFDEIRISKKSLADAAGVGGPAPTLSTGKFGERKAKDAPNILFITMDEGLPNPFYCVGNVSDPHKPFYNDQKSIEQGFVKYAPSRVYDTSDVVVPAFLPEQPEIREEMRNYYNSVKRGDDCVGAIPHTLKQRGFADNTVVVSVSDHGKPLPCARSSLYPDGLRTPLIMSLSQLPHGTVRKTS